MVGGGLGRERLLLRLPARSRLRSRTFAWCDERAGTFIAELSRAESVNVPRAEVAVPFSCSRGQEGGGRREEEG